jgi:hypothetical protein
VRRREGRAGVVLLLAGACILVGTLAYGASYLHAEEPVFAQLEGPIVGVEGAKKRTPIGVNLMVNACQWPVDVGVAAFSSGRGADSPLRFVWSNLFSRESSHSSHAIRNGGNFFSGHKFEVPRPGTAEPLVIPTERVTHEIRYQPDRSTATTDVVTEPYREVGEVVAAARFEADWLTRRDSNSCILALPRASADPYQQSWGDVDRVPSVVRLVVSTNEVRIDREASLPPPRIAADGSATWTCRGRQGACAGFAVLSERTAASDRDLNLLVMGLLFGTGSAAVLEGLMEILRARPINVR